eukprot:gnl/MRDRNA2_/MRDRNA2_20375_c0_seq1.p1 gnl/MRDRNA2_/MRDRNA2_20375_c0~~gnl/MRDRNA2_/MRDRNA2_20375_c0_seq1.p1  ORF type:complete len:379 (+),score=66.40 gnl/MRDRNA2_/MRDRNA2_20375_c0_seq1:76-1212(+)
MVKVPKQKTSSKKPAHKKISTKASNARNQPEPGKKKAKDPLRVIVYGVGKCNLLAVRFMCERGIKVVGAITRPGPKVGKDLGELAGLAEKLGVIVSENPAMILGGVPADAVLVGVYDDLERMLPILNQCVEHKLNVISIGAHHSNAWRSHPEASAALDKLAKRFGVTVTGTGNQDFYMVNLGVALAGTCNRVDALIHRSLQDVNLFGPEVASTQYVGQSRDAFESFLSSGKVEPSIYTSFWDNVASDMGLTVKGIKQSVLPVLATEPVHCVPLAREILPGELLGNQTILEVETAEGVTMRGEYSFWICNAGSKTGEAPYKEWEIQGEPAAQKVRATNLDGLTSTVAQAVNRIPDVIAAPAGYVTLEKLPKLKFRSTLR